MKFFLIPKFISTNLGEEGELSQRLPIKGKIKIPKSPHHDKKKSKGCSAHFLPPLEDGIWKNLMGTVALLVPELSHKSPSSLLF